MDTKQIILYYYPHWLLGIAMIIATLRSEHKDLMRFQPKSFLKFAKIMAIVTAVRCVMMYLFPISHAQAAPILNLPIALTAQVFWEDATFVLPIALASRFLGNSWPAKIAIGLLTLLMMISFGSGHLYQGMGAAIMLSFYIPVVRKLGEKHGFATTIACHMLYDFLTLLTVKMFLGF